MWVQSLGREDLQEKGMAIHSSVLAWRISETEEPGLLLSIGSQSQTRLKSAHTQPRKGHCCKDLARSSVMYHACLRPACD